MRGPITVLVLCAIALVCATSIAYPMVSGCGIYTIKPEKLSQIAASYRLHEQIFRDANPMVSEYVPENTLLSLPCWAIDVIQKQEQQRIFFEKVAKDLSPAEVRLSFDKQTVTVGDEVVLTVTARAENIFAVDFRIAFDEGLEAVGMVDSLGDAEKFVAVERLALCHVEFAGTRLSPVLPLQGDVTLLTVRFRANQAGTHNIRVILIEVLDEDSNGYPLEPIESASITVHKHRQYVPE